MSVHKVLTGERTTYHVSLDRQFVTAISSVIIPSSQDFTCFLLTNRIFGLFLKMEARRCTRRFDTGHVLYCFCPA